MTKGWCAVHDRVFETPDKLCPECGTALVDVQPRLPGDRAVVVPEAEDEPDDAVQSAPVDAATSSAFPIGPATLATVVTAVIVVAFLAGLTFPRGRRVVPTTAVPQARADYTIGVDRRGAGVTLHLRSFSQRGPRIILRVAVDPAAPVASGHIDTASVTLSSAGGREQTTTDLEVRPTTYGFVAEGVAVSPDEIVTAVRIDSVRASTPKGVTLEVPVDLSRVWREGAATDVAPRDRTFGDGRTLRRLSFVGWPDRLEARLEIAGERADWFYDDAYMLRRSRLSAEGRLDPPDAAGVRHVFFVAPRSVERSARLVIIPRTVLVAGSWFWTLPSGG